MKAIKLYINNINKIREEFNKFLDKKLKEDFCGNDFEKRIKLLKSDHTTKKLLNDYNENQSGGNLDLSNLNNNNQSYFLYINNGLNNTSLAPTCYNSNINSNTSSSFSQVLIEKQFNLARINFCLKHKLYDVPLTPELENFNHPVKYQINNDYFSYVYSNELTTFCCTVSGCIFKSSMLNNTKISREYKGSKFNQVLGLYICGKEIKLDENITKKCAPNEFICKDCIKINKEIYNLKDHYLINICGRVAKKNKGIFHCFGHFLVNDKIEECISSFTCKACSFLNSFNNYYKIE